MGFLNWAGLVYSLSNDYLLLLTLIHFTFNIRFRKFNNFSFPCFCFNLIFLPVCLKLFIKLCFTFFIFIFMLILTMRRVSWIFLDFFIFYFWSFFYEFFGSIISILYFIDSKIIMKTTLPNPISPRPPLPSPTITGSP